MVARHPQVSIIGAGLTVHSPILPLEPQVQAVLAFFPGGLTWWWPAMRWGGARRSLGARDFVAIRIHTPAEASAAVTLQGQEVALLVTLGDVEPGPRVGMLCLGIALLVFTGLQSRRGVFWNWGRERHKGEITGRATHLL